MLALIERNKPAVADLCRRFKVRRLDFFGSAAAGAFDPKSLDDSSPSEYTDNYFGLANELERLFRRRVDLLTERSIRNPLFFDRSSTRPAYRSMRPEEAKLLLDVWEACQRKRSVSGNKEDGSVN